MDRALPEYNTILHQKWIAENRRTHKKKIRDTKCIVDNKLPLALKYPHIKSKKELIIEGKSKFKISIFKLILFFILNYREMHTNRKIKSSSPRKDDQHTRRASDSSSTIQCNKVFAEEFE